MKLDLHMSNQIIAIMVFFLFSYIGVWMMVKKKLKEERLQKLFYKDSVGSLNNIIDKIKEENKNISYIEKIEKELKQARSSFSVQSYIITMIVSCILIILIVYKILGLLILAIPFGALGVFVPQLIVKNQRRKFMEKFDKEMVKALRRMSAVLRSGGSLENALEDVTHSNIIPDYVKKEFKKVLITYKAGFSIEESFYKLYESVGSPDTLYLCVSIDIQMETGGDKDVIFDNIASAISNRNLKSQNVKAKLAEVNVSTNVLTFMPIPFAVVIYIYNPHHFDFFKATMQGRLLGLVLIGFMIFGFFIVKKLSRIDY